MELKADDTGAAIVPVLACVLNQLCDRNDHHPDNVKTHPSKFHALRPPAITINDYLLRIAKYAACSGECFVLALVYIDRIIQSNPNFVVNSLNIHRLLITSVMLAAKFFDDQYFNNAYYAKVGGVPKGEMNSLEVDFLFMTNFTLFVPTEQYRQYYTELCNHARNNACSCNAQDGKIPELAIPMPDAGTLRGLRSPHLSPHIRPEPFVPNLDSCKAISSNQDSEDESEIQPAHNPAMMTDSPVQTTSTSRTQSTKHSSRARAAHSGDEHECEGKDLQGAHGPSAMAF